MIPKNEQELVYLFSRNHEKLGFEKIVSFNPHGFPDCFALKDGKEVGIEFELKSMKFAIHYYKKKFEPVELYDYEIIRDKILVYRKDSPSSIEGEFDTSVYEIWTKEKFDIPLSMWVKSYHLRKKPPLVIKFKTLSNKVQYMVCWENDHNFSDDFQVIELKNMNLS